MSKPVSNTINHSQPQMAKFGPFTARYISNRQKTEWTGQETAKLS